MDLKSRSVLGRSEYLPLNGFYQEFGMLARALGLFGEKRDKTVLSAETIHGRFDFATPQHPADKRILFPRESSPAQ